MISLDTIVQSYLALMRTSPFTEFFYLITILFDFSTHFFIVCIATAFLIYLFRNLKYSILFLTTTFLGASAVYILKMFFDVSRPMDGVMEAFGKSFPSGHATVATVFFVMLMFTFDDYFVGIKRHIFNFFCISSIFLIAISRVYLGVHWVSDVLGGVGLGLIVSYICAKVFQKFT